MSKMNKIPEEENEESLESEAFVSCDEEHLFHQPKDKRKKILTSFERENQQLKRRLNQFAKASKEIESILSNRKKIEIMPIDFVKEKIQATSAGAGAGDDRTGHSDAVVAELQTKLSKAARKEKRYRNGIAILNAQFSTFVANSSV
ncbi:Oidioi.mRNA.OKI2018_I69.PAR.g11762.t1.cds [Oikopleura dioica]|uniref:Oidioi.mRNA.OKI2018_I69.PAR.g11762.t1.cds n=1 Tax=Oikopleura dioica TaxID=34765 RepID=A0ABN7S0I2_OIKDI|nr:Oidioi.mRNA.OKI2018_I69.PAR.g11762.t1.cds [Oikopleura dioica]